MAGPMKSLSDKYCIVGVGETEYSRNSGRTTRALAVEAVRKAILDAGLTARDVDVVGGGSSTEALIWLAMGAIETGMCSAVAIFRSMNGYSEVRIGGTGTR